MKNPMVVVFPPLYCSTIAAFHAKTSLARSSISLLSIAGASNHFSLIISSRFFHVDNISSIIIFN